MMSFPHFLSYTILIIDDAAAILAGDIESWNQSMNSKKRAEENN